MKTKYCETRLRPTLVGVLVAVAAGLAPVIASLAQETELAQVQVPSADEIGVHVFVAGS